MSIECPACKVERDLESYSLTKNPTAGSVCDFCQEAGVKPPEPPQEPKKRGRKPKAPPDPIRPVESPPEAPKTVDKLPSDAAEEAYSAPAFDAQAAEANPAKELAARELCRRRLMPFIQRYRPKYMPGWVHKDICRRLERFVERVEAGEEPRLLLMMPPRGGKQLADETMVPTPTGWRRHGELKAGDEVFHPSGRPVRVLAVSEKTPSQVKVTFSDGSAFHCHENHEWTLYNRMRGEWQTLETNHFLGAKVLHGGRSTYQLPVVEPLQYGGTEFLTHPYVLGTSLGDGSAGKPCVTGAGLVSVEYVGGDRIGHCIQVDSPDGLYVVGEKLTVTHNSEIGSRHFPAWVLGKHPEWEIIAASHTGSLTLSFSRYIRDLLRDPAYNVVFPNTHLDPSSQSVENWNLMEGGGYLAAGVGTGITGRGCLAPYTLVDTNRGKMRIIDLKVGDSVYGYDHEHKEVVTTRVRAVQVTERSKHLLDFGKIRLTTDHRIYNASRGFYTRAGESPSLLGLRRKEGASCCDVQGVLFEGADGSDHIAQMRLLWEELHAQRCGAPKVTGSTRSGCEGVLRSSLLRHVQNQQPGGVQQGEGRVPALQETCDGNGSFEVLHQGLLQRVQGFETADGCLQWRVSDAKEAGIGARQEVLALRNDKRSVRCASHQSGRDGQPDFESGAALHGVPPQISSVHGTCAADIAKLFESFDFVVDIQTETGNFFTEGLLVHNCHILLLDDLVKDQEAADSPTIRENTWEWYISTAHSRLAPGGGVLGIMCMTGDTPVLMADGTERRLDTLTTSDEVATYANGRLAATKVNGFKSNGRDSVFKITTSSGKVVRANQRHPFLTLDPKGELVWTRTRALTTAHKIATVQGNGGSGRVSPVLLTAVTPRPYVEGCVPPITPKSDGPTGIAQGLTTTNPGAMHGSSTATESQLPTTTQCTSGRVDVARSAKSLLRREAHLGTGRASSPSITATTPGKSEGCSATTATQESDTLELSQWHSPLPNTSDFTLEDVVSVEFDCIEEVFDVQIAHTENFIANGLVSHNTWWSEDDWAGRIQEAMKGDGEKFEIVRYPAINDEGDEYILPDDSIEQIPPGSPVPEGSVMTRPMNSALHPERYDYKALIKKKLNYMAAGMVRMWNALYQQNPTPDSGIMFTKDLFRRYVHAPSRRGRLIYQAWDFAITENTNSDWTVCATIMQDEFDNLYVLDIFKFKSDDGNAIVEHMIDQYVLWDADYLGMEDGQIWKSLRSQFEKRCKERKVYPSTQILVPLTDKLVRANPLKGRMQLGKVLFPEAGSRPWVDGCVREMIVFPNGKHDDQVDACFVAGTPIAMADGSTKPIELVAQGDLVATPIGPRVVTHAWLSKRDADVVEAEFSNGAILRGTAAHPFATDRGWVELSNLTPSDKLQGIVSQQPGESSCRGFTRKQPPTSSDLSSTERFIAATLTRLEGTFGGISRALVAFYTGTFGSFTTALSLKAAKFITKMETISTTTFGTWSASLGQDTKSSILRSEARSEGLTHKFGISRRSARKRLTGTSPRKEGVGTQNMGRRPGKDELQQPLCAGSVGLDLSLSGRMPHSVQKSVSGETGASATLVMTRRSVLEQRQDVFNISVDEAECYYAAGILVHNCAWAVRMTLERPPPKDPTPKPKGPESWKKKLQRMLSGQGGGHMAA